MDQILTEEQIMIRDTVGAFLRDRYGDAERRRIIDSEAGWSPTHWAAFANELGLFGAGLPIEFDGLGGGAAAHALIMEQFGAALVVEPYVSTMVIGCGFLAQEYAAGARDLIAGIVSGKAVIAYAHGEAKTRYNHAHVTTRATRDGNGYVLNGSKAVVLGGPWATHFIVIARTAGSDTDANGISAFVVDASSAGIERRDFSTISGGRASELTLSDVRVPATALLTPEGAALPLIERVIDEATAVICAEAVGVMRRLHADALAYIQQRHQFGRALGSFQVLQHRMVDMLTAITLSSAMVERAVDSLSGTDIERAKAVSAAKVFVGKSARLVGQQTIQLHGGMGMTDELAAGFFFKRTMEIGLQFGSTDHHLTRYQRLAFEPADATGEVK